MFGLKFKAPGISVPEQHYRAVVDHARDPLFYREFGAPDTVEGRFDLLVLHLVLLFRRLRAEGEIGEALAQDVFDLFVRDMDRSMREMGVGDLGMKRRMREIARGFYARANDYNSALNAGDRDGLATALERNLFSQASRPGLARELARAAFEIEARLNETTRAELLAGEASLGVRAPGPVSS